MTAGSQPNAGARRVPDRIGNRGESRPSMDSLPVPFTSQLRGRFASLDTATTARGMAAVEEDGGEAGDG